MPIQPGTDIGRYHILEQLGEGGMAVVYKAYDTRLETEVAVKVIRTGSLPPDSLPRIFKRFSIEAKKMAQLTHLNIIKVTDYGDYKGAPYLVMPYLPGGTLKEKLAQSMSINESVKILLPIADALGYAHKKGLVHRDIKPSNILITESGKPMLSDFGVAKILESNETLDLTTTGMGVGTPEYMAPEQGEGRSFDHRADIYALGIVLYEMVTGRKPFTADTPMAVIVKQMHDPLPNPNTLNPDLPVEVEQVLFKTLAKDPNARYKDMGTFAAALEKLASAEPKIKKKPDIHKKMKEPWGGKPFDSRSLIGVMSVIGAGIVIFAGIKLFGGGEVPTNTKTSEIVSLSNQVIVSPLKIGSEMISEMDGMKLLYVPAGEFEMGSEDGDSDEQPIHTMYLDAYWIDQTEVTNTQYQQCVDDEACDSPYDTEYFIDSNYSDHPVVNVSWYDAQNYCKWAGRRLPTEAEWEKAARGTDGRTYPWGEGIDCNRANYGECDEFPNTFPVGHYGERGASPYGAYDMAGNVWEWVQDWYDESYYTNSPACNPAGPFNGNYRVLRGGSWQYDELRLTRSAHRDYNDSDNPYYNIGFRCAFSDQFIPNDFLYKENFEESDIKGEIPSGWHQWQIKEEDEYNHVLSIDMIGSDLYPDEFSFGDYSWNNTIIQYRVKIETCGTNTGGGATINLGERYYLNMSCRYNQIYFNQWNGLNILEINIDVSEDKWYEITIDNSNSQLSIFIDENKVGEVLEFSTYPGNFGFSTDPGSLIYFDNIQVAQGYSE